jgi:hypothetical protein
MVFTINITVDCISYYIIKWKRRRKEKKLKNLRFMFT